MLDTIERLDTKYQPRAFQQEIHDLMARHRYVTAICHRRAGKTVLAINALIFSALANPGRKFAYFAPTTRQARRIAEGLLLEYSEGIPGAEYHRSEATLKLSNGSQIGLMSLEDADAARGQGYWGIVVDEIASVGSAFEAWSGAIAPTLSDAASEGTGGGWALIVGTPRGGEDLLAEFFRRGQSDEFPDWASISFPAWPTNTTGALADAEVAAARKTAISEDHFLREYGCDLSATGENQLIPTAAVLEAQARVLPRAMERDINRYPRILGVDIGFTRDATVLTEVQGPLVRDPIYLHPEKPSEAAAAIATQIRQRNITTVYLDDGGGFSSGVKEFLENMGFVALGVQFGSRPVNREKFANKRAELYNAMAEFIRQPSTILPKGHEILRDLTASRFEFTASGQLKIEDKDKVRARLGRSPDFADSLALAVGMPNPMTVDLLPPVYSGTPSFTRGPDGSKYHSHDPGRALREQRGPYRSYDPFEQE